ncbi:MAG: hypothetical protein WBE31_14405 [Candidatus Sulfotelmatobacter sp.]
MECLKMVLLSIAAGVFYGIVHDQVTVRICPEYFTVFHPPLLPIDFPAMLVALAWGVVATWWAAAILGIALALAARSGSRTKLTTRDVLPLISRLLAAMAAAAVVFGVAGFLPAKKNIVVPPAWVQSHLPPSRFPNFMADWWAHSASYGAAFLGGALLCVIAYRKRRGVLREI